MSLKNVLLNKIKKRKKINFEILMWSKIHHFNGNIKTEGNNGLMDIKVQQAIGTNIFNDFFY